MLDPELLQTLAKELPALVLFAAVMFITVKLFLDHLTKQEETSRQFIKEQREANNQAISLLADKHSAAIRDLMNDQRATIDKWSSSLCADLDKLAAGVHELILIEVGHDAFVRTSFKERFGPATTERAEEAAKSAEVTAMRK
jgi:UDP-2,3-diacylglucosamine pyrophosphatase LpxH